MKKAILVLMVLFALLLAVPVVGAQDEAPTLVEAVEDANNLDFGVLVSWVVSSLFLLVMTSFASEFAIERVKTFLDDAWLFINKSIFKREDYNSRLLWDNSTIRQIVILVLLVGGAWLYVDDSQANLFTTAPDVIQDNLSTWWQQAWTVVAFAASTMAFHRQSFLDRVAGLLGNAE